MINDPKSHSCLMFCIVSYAIFHTKSRPFQWLWVSLIKLKWFHWVFQGQSTDLGISLTWKSETQGKNSGAWSQIWKISKAVRILSFSSKGQMIKNSFNLFITHFNQFLTLIQTTITFLNLFFNFHIIFFLYHNQLNQEPRIYLNIFLCGPNSRNGGCRGDIFEQNY